MPVEVSVVIPTYNGAKRIGACLSALLHQASTRAVELIVVDDGSTDNTAEVVRGFPGVRLITQPNAGPATARNRGAQEAQGELLLFTDDDCVPVASWIEEMIAPFSDREVVGTKGVYRTRQRALVARFVQVEYEDRYRIMSAFPNIDFIDTYSAAFVRRRFLEMNGYNTAFPTACAEDVELSYRMAARGWKMRFHPAAVVYHTHPDKLSGYIRKKYKFAFWRVLAVRNTPSKAARDTHTPQLMKLQLLFLPALLVAIGFDLATHDRFFASAVVTLSFFLSALPFAARARRKSLLLAWLSPLLLAARASAQVLGVIGGLAYVCAHTKPNQTGDSRLSTRGNNKAA